MGSKILISKRFQSARPSAADGFELPGSITLIDTSEFYCGFGGEILVELVLQKFLSIGGIVDTDESIPHLTEVLPAGFRLVDSHRNDDLGDLRVDSAKVHVNSLVIPVTLAGSVVSGVAHGLIRRFEVVVENDVGFASTLSVLADKEGGGVEVKALAGRCQRIGIPTQTDGYLLETDIDTLTFGEIKSHRNNELGSAVVGGNAQDRLTNEFVRGGLADGGELPSLSMTIEAT